MPVCKDTLADPAISIPFSLTVDVSGGGAALANAVVAAGANTRLRIIDSLTYDPVLVSGKTNLTIEAAPGETPVISRPAPASFPSTVPGWALKITGAVDGLALRGLTFVDHGNRNSLSFADNGLVVAREDCTGLTRVVVEDCIFQEDPDSPLNGLNGVVLICGGAGAPTYDQVVVRRCTFDTLGAGPNNTAENLAAITICGFGDVWIQNSWILRDRTLVARATSHQRGVNVRNANTVIEDVLVDDVGSGGSNEAFNHILSSGAQFGSVVGATSVRNCVAYNAKRGFRSQLSGATLTVLRSVFHADTVGIVHIAARVTAGATLVVRDSVLVAPGDGQAFESSAVTEDHNDVFTFATLGKTLDATDLQRDPVFADVGSNDWEATDAQVAIGATDGGAMGVRYGIAGDVIFWCG